MRGSCQANLTWLYWQVNFTFVKNDVRELRAAKGLSQGRLAEKMDVSRQTINAIETGRYTPSLPLAISLSRFFGRRVEEVLHAE